MKFRGTGGERYNDIDPCAYLLRDVLAKIVARRRMSRVDELLPFAYAQATERPDHTAYPDSRVQRTPLSGKNSTHSRV